MKARRKRAGPARVLLDKLHSRVHAQAHRAMQLKPRRIRKSAAICLSDFVSHLEWLKSRHCPKTYQDAYLVSWVFRKPKAFNTHSEIAGYCRAHLVVALDQLKKLITKMRAGRPQVTEMQLRKYQPYLTDYLFDLRLIAQTLERRKDSTYEFFSAAKRTA